MASNAKMPPRATSLKASAGRPVDVATPADVQMELLLEKLRVLNYESEYCKRNGARPFSRYHFAFPASNKPEETLCRQFITLAWWLLDAAGREGRTPRIDFSNLSLATEAVVSECSAMGLATALVEKMQDQLVAGCGVGVVGLLNGLADMAIEKQGFVWEAPQHTTSMLDGGSEEEDVDDQVALLADDDDDLLSDDEEPMPLETTTAQTLADSLNLSTTDPEAWRLECEKVAPELRLTIAEGSKDWRSNLKLIRRYTEQLPDTWTDIKTGLNRVHVDTANALEKVNNRAAHLSSHCDNLVRQYGAAQEELAKAREDARVAQTEAADLENQLANATQEVAAKGAEVEARSSGMRDTSALLAIKAVIKTIKEELVDMDVRTGILQHTLLSVSARSTRSVGHGGGRGANPMAALAW